jgi:NADPH-dependent curcumin reductase CurA
MAAINRQLVLRARRDGVPHVGDFAVEEAPVPAPGEGEFVVRNLYASLDPALRQRLTLTDSYVPRIELGEVLTATTVGVVAASCDPAYPVGQHVVGHHGIADYWLTRAGPVTRAIDPSAVGSLSHYLSICGPTGLTAYFGITRIARPRPGETLLVSGAAGAVGSVAGQIARLAGCRVVGIAGGPEKARRLTEEYGFDAGIDYRGHDLASLTAAIRSAVPQGVDMVFENVGGIQLDAAIDCVNERGRIAVCGLISQYNATEPLPPLTNLFKLVARSIRMEGFIVRNYSAEYGAAAARLAQWARAGKIRFREDIHDGLEAGPEAFLTLFSGANQGKVMLRLDPAA